MRISRIAIALVVLFATATVVARAPVRLPSKSKTGAASRPAVQVFIPGNVSGYFGNPVDQMNPLVPAVTVSGPGTITVTYVSGTVVIGNGIETGPDGAPCNCRDYQLPLDEAHGIGGHYTRIDGALMGVFVAQSRVEDRRGFTAIDGTKNATRVGIRPGSLFFIGDGKTFDVKEAGTLFLGINDGAVNDNSGGFNVEVSVQ